MQEPKIHSAIVPFLPPDHWLLPYWEAMADSLLDGDLVPCEECGKTVYSISSGTMRTWIESGRLVMEGDEPEPQIMCMLCFSHLEGSGFPVTREWWALTDDGGPQAPETVDGS